MSEATTRPIWLWFPVLLYGVVGAVSLFNLLRLALAAADITLPEYLFVALWAFGPLFIGVGLLRTRRWAWWLGLTAPLLYVIAFVLELLFLLFNSGDGALVGFVGHLMSLLPIVALSVACLSLLAPSVRRHFAVARTQRPALE
jgi:hypothetical protein